MAHKRLSLKEVHFQMKMLIGVIIIVIALVVMPSGAFAEEFSS